MRETNPVAILFYTVLDPQAAIEECPAITTLLYKVVGQETTKFDEAV